MRTLFTFSVSSRPDTAGSDDFVPKTVDIVFQPGETGPKQVVFDVIDDKLNEPNEEFIVFMSSSSPGVTVGGPAVVVIQDNDGKMCNVVYFIIL